MSVAITDVDTFTNPVVVPEDGDDRNAVSVDTPFQALANRTYNSKLRLDGIDGATHAWTAQHTFTLPPNYATPPTRTSYLNMLEASDATGSNTLSWTTDSAVVVPVAGAIDIRIPFRMPVGSSFTQVNAYVFNGTAGATLTLKLMKRSGVAFGSSVQVGSTHTLAGATSGQHALAVASFTETPDDSTWYWLVVTSTDSTGAGTIDTATVTWSDPGPRTMMG